MKEMTEEEKMMEKGYLTSPQNAKAIERILKKHHVTKVDRVA
jgi:hypothetical protein